MPSQTVTYLGIVINSMILTVFPAPTCFEAVGVGRRISLLREAACRLMEGTTGSSLIPDPADSGREATDEGPPACPQVVLGLSGKVSSSRSLWIVVWISMVDGAQSSGTGLFSEGDSPGPDVPV